MASLEIQPAQPWFERWPELLTWELGRFEALGLPAALDSEARDQGQIRIQTEANFDGRTLEITVAYPAEYPELPPTIHGPPGLLERHQDRFDGNFCLLPRPLDDWPAREWGAADLVATRLNALLQDSAAGAAQVQANEAPMPEPVSSYFHYALDLAVVMPAEALPAPDKTGGTLSLRRTAPHQLLLVASDDAVADPAMLAVVGNGEEHFVRWKRIEAAPTAGPGGDEVAEWIRTNHPELVPRRPPPPPPRKRARRKPSRPTLELCALVFPEEGPGVGETRDAWMFCLIGHGVGERSHLLHAELASPEERSRRLPELDGLDSKSVAVVGLGTLGAPTAIELARAGLGILQLVDFDRYEFGNTTRHPLGIEFVGLPKTAAVATACVRANPRARVERLDLRLGSTNWAGAPNPISQLVPVLAQADLLVDTTGSHQLAQVLSRLCWEAEIPFLCAWMTDGFWGGEVVRVIPSRTCCWTCFASRQRAGETLHAEAGPPLEVVVQGCSHPTTTGAGFDSGEIAALSARLAVQTLRPDGGYPESNWDHAAVSFRRAHDDREQPRFAAEKLPATQNCEACGCTTGVQLAR